MSAAFRLSGSFESHDAETALLWAAGCVGIEEREGALIAYFDRPTELPLDGAWQEVDEVDWLARYYAELAPVRVGRLVVSPTHCSPETGPEDRLLWLDPGMAFGTGHHVTTRLALGALEALDLAEKAVLDVGAGSGILAIAADLLGAGSALGIDIDPQTLPVAQSNRALNRSRARFAVGVLSDRADASADVLVANLFAELHAELAPQYRRVLRPGGVLLATGILGERLGLVLEALGAFFATESRLEDGWALVKARA